MRKNKKTELPINKIICDNNIRAVKKFPNNSIDLIITSPPYDNLRDYEGYVFNFKYFKNIAKGIYRIMKKGCVVVWIVNDATKNGSETGSSFRQVLFFKKIGFKLHDTMIWNKGGFSAIGSLKVRYSPVFEYMFILCKGNLKTFNPIKDRKTIWGGRRTSGTIRNSNGSLKPMSKTMIINEYSQRFNIWNIYPKRQSGKNTHPAPFPIQIPYDHIRSWSNIGDIVLDPFAGLGTTLVAAEQLERRWIGIDVSKKYCEIARKQLDYEKRNPGLGIFK